MEKKQKPMIFLKDVSILPWERPLPEGTVSMLSHFKGSTKIKGYYGRGVLDTERSPYIISATAAIYLAGIARGRELAIGEKKAIPQEEILFSGGIQIFKRGKIPGTEVAGLNLLVKGDIWYAEKWEKFRDKNGKDDYLLTETGLVTGLKHIIFGDEREINGQIARIEMVVRGYQYKEEMKEKMQSDRETENYRKGRLDALEHGGRWGCPF